MKITYRIFVETLSEGFEVCHLNDFYEAEKQYNRVVKSGEQSVHLQRKTTKDILFSNVKSYIKPEFAKRKKMHEQTLNKLSMCYWR